MNILITGAFGFIGKNLSAGISPVLNPHLIAVDIVQPENHACNNYFHWNDLEKIDLEKIDAFIHLAGKAHDLKNGANEQEYFDINLGLTRKIFEYFMKSGASKFIFFSSVKAIRDSVKGTVLKEEDLPEPKTAYGKSKLAAETYILSQPVPENKKVYILRPCMIHGPGNKGNLNLLYNLVKKGVPWPLGKFENKRSFVSVSNLIFIINKLLEKDVPQGIYQIADDEGISTNRLIQLIAETNHWKPRILNINKKAIVGLAKIGDVIHLPLNSERLNKLTETYLVSNGKIKNSLGIERLPVSSEEGLIMTLESFK